MSVLLEWLVKNIATLRASGDSWQLVLHGGADGRIAREVKMTGELLPSKRHK